MLHHPLRRISQISILACLLMLLAVPAGAQQQDDAGRHQVIEGVSVYLGVLPIQMAKNESDELNLPGKVYKEEQRYYVLLAMFDGQTGRRIVKANIKAKVQALGGLDFSEKKLKPIHIEKLISFGNYFHMPDPDLYKIDFTIGLPGKQPIVAHFVYRRPTK